MSRSVYCLVVLFIVCTLFQGLICSFTEFVAGVNDKGKKIWSLEERTERGEESAYTVTFPDEVDHVALLTTPCENREVKVQPAGKVKFFESLGEWQPWLDFSLLDGTKVKVLLSIKGNFKNEWSNAMFTVTPGGIPEPFKACSPVPLDCEPVTLDGLSFRFRGADGCTDIHTGLRPSEKLTFDIGEFELPEWRYGPAIFTFGDKVYLCHGDHVMWKNKAGRNWMLIGGVSAAVVVVGSLATYLMMAKAPASIGPASGAAAVQLKEKIKKNVFRKA